MSNGNNYQVLPALFLVRSEFTYINKQRQHLLLLKNLLN